MTTRIFCDNCGNTTRTPHKFGYGPYPSYTLSYPQTQGSYQQAISTLGSGLGSGLGPGSPVVTPTKDVEIIDLCDHCVNIWMARVKALTQVSDVQPA